MPVNKKLLQILTEKSFTTNEAKQALNALVLAGPTQERLLRAFEEHKAFWFRVDADLPEKLTAEHLLAEGEGQEKAANNLHALWIFAIKKYGADHLTAGELGEHMNVFGNINPPSTDLTKILQVYETNQKTFDSNSTIFEQKIKPENDEGNKQLLVRILNNLPLDQQNIIVRKLNDERNNKNYLANLMQAKTSDEFIKVLGIQPDQTLPVTVGDVTTSLGKVIRKFCHKNTKLQNETNTKVFAAVLEKFKFEGIDEQRDALIELFSSLSDSEQQRVLAKIRDPRHFIQIFQAESFKDLSKYLGVTLIENDASRNFLVANQAFTIRKLEMLEEDTPLPVAKAGPRRTNYRHIDNQHHYQYDKHRKNYDKAVQKHHQEKVQISTYAHFHRYLNAFVSLDNAPNIASQQKQNLEDAFALSPNLEAFKKCIVSPVNFGKIIDNKKVGGFFSGDYLPSKTIGYKLNGAIVDEFELMTETEFQDLKSQTRKNRLETANSREDKGYAAEETKKYLELDQDIILDPLATEFATIKKQIPEFINGLEAILYKDKQNPGNLYLGKSMLESASSKNVAAFKETIEDAFAAGQTMLETLEEQKNQLKAYRKSIKTLRHEKAHALVADQKKWVDDKIKEIETEQKQLQTFLNRHIKPVEGTIASIESVISASAGTSVRLADDPSLWETIIRNVDPAHAPDMTRTRSAQPDASIDNVANNNAVPAQTPEELKRYEPRLQKGQVLEYLVDCKNKDAPDDNGVFRKARHPNPKNPGKEHITIEIVVVPDNGDARAKTAMRAASEFLKTHVKGQPIRLGGKDAGAVADLFHALQKLGVKENEITFKPDCAFDPEKHKGIFYGFEAKTPGGESETRMDENKTVVNSSRKNLDHYHALHRNVNADLIEVTRKAKTLVNNTKLTANKPEEVKDIQNPAPGRKP